MSQVRKLANGHLLWDQEFTFILRGLNTLAIYDPDILKALIKKCIYPEYNFSSLEILILRHAKFIFPSENTVEQGVYTLKQVNNVILSEFKKLGIDNTTQLKEVLKNLCGPKGLDIIIERLKLNLGGYTWEKDPPGDLVAIIAAEIQKLENQKSKKLIPNIPTDFSCTPTMTAKIIGFLSDYQYPLLLITILGCAGIYDRYHQNHVGKIKNMLKTQIFSIFQPAQKDEINYADVGISCVGSF